MRQTEYPELYPTKDGKYIDYYCVAEDYDDHELLIGLTRDYAEIRSDIADYIDDFGSAFLIFMGALAAICLLMSQIAVLRPLEIIQENIRLYRDTKDSKAVEKSLSEIRASGEIEQLAQNLSDLTKEIDDYTEEIRKITSERERMETELTLAARIQAAMLPRNYPAYPDRNDFDICGSMTPAREIGGDF